MADDREILSALNALQKKLDSMLSKLDGTIRNSSSNRTSASSSSKNTTDELGKAAKKLTRETKTRAELIEELNKTDKKVWDSATNSLKVNKKYTTLIRQLTGTLSNVQESLEDQAEELHEVVTHSKKNRREQQRYLDLYSQSMQNSTTEMGRNIKKSSMLGSALLRASSAIEEGSLEYHKMMENLYDSSKPLGENLLRYADAWDDSTKAIKQGLSRADFANINMKIGNAAAELADSMKGLEGAGFGSIDELMGKSEDELLKMFKGANDVNSSAGKLKSAMISAALGLEAAGLNVGAGLGFDKNGNKRESINNSKLNDLNKAGQTLDGHYTAEGKAATEELIKILKSIGETQQKTAKAQNEFTRNAVMGNTELGKLVLTFQDARKTNGAFVSSLKTAPAAIKLLSSAASSVGNVIHKFAPAFNALQDFNVAFVPLDFVGTNVQAAKMGMSLEATTKYLQENKNTLALYGKDFDSLQTKLTGQFVQFGMTMEQAASTVQPSISAAIASGVDVQNQEALAGSIKQTLDGFTKLSGILNITTEQYATANQDLLTSHDIQATLVGMDAARTKETAKGITAQRDEYATRLLSLQAAQELIKLQHQQGREKIMERTKAGAFAMLAAQQAGMSSADSVKLFQISQKADSRRTAAERKFLTDLMGKIALSQKQNVINAGDDGSALMVENSNSLINERLGTLGQIGEAQTSMFANDKANAIATPAQRDAANAAAAANVTVAQAGQAINQVSSVMTNTFLASLVGGTVGVTALGFQALMAAKNLRGIGGGGFSGGGPGGGPGGAGKAGRLGKLGGKLLKGGLVGIVGGLTLDYAADKLNESGHTQAGAVASTGSSALAGAGMGAMLGSVVPGVGTLVGGAVGGALGGAYGLYQNWGNLTQDGGMLSSDKLKSAALMAIPGAGLIAAGAGLIGTPGINPVPSVTGLGQSMASSSAGNVNKVSVLAASDSATPDKNLAVIDTTAHNYFSDMVDNLQKAVTLLQQIAVNNPSVINQIASDPHQMTPILPATAYYQGRS